MRQQGMSNAARNVCQEFCKRTPFQIIQIFNFIYYIKESDLYIIVDANRKTFYSYIEKLSIPNIFVLKSYEDIANELSI